jgi:hypothetical protein
VTASDFVITIGKWPRSKLKHLHSASTKTKKLTKPELQEEYEYSDSSRRSGYSHQMIYRPDELPRNVDCSFQNTSGRIEQRICGDRLLQDFGGSLSRLEIFVHSLTLSNLNTYVVHIHPDELIKSSRSLHLDVSSHVLLNFHFVS